MNSNKIVSLFLVVLFTSASCFGSQKSASNDKDKKPTEHHRGWIGGEFKLARRHWSWSSTAEEVIAFPKSLTNAQKAGILITALSTNTPAYLAGLREADLILELDGEKTTNLSRFRRKIDQAKPGDALMVHVYREGELLDYSVMVGRETFTENGSFGLALFFDLPVPSLKFNPSFSLIALGLSQESDQRTELGSAEQVYRRASAKEHRPSDVCWRAWVGPLFAMHTRQIHSQEIIAR
jgi:membrane-associated protease RseP (regulator of RpoE activity)